MDFSHRRREVRTETYSDDWVALSLVVMGVGFPAMIVTTLGEPSLLVLVKVSVTNGGALVTVCPALFVVVTNTVDCNVVLWIILRRQSRNRVDRVESTHVAAGGEDAPGELSITVTVFVTGVSGTG